MSRPERRLRRGRTGSTRRTEPPAAGTHDHTALTRLMPHVCECVCMCVRMKEKLNDTVLKKKKKEKRKAKNALPTFTARWLNKDMDVFVCFCIYHVY